MRRQRFTPNELAARGCDPIRTATVVRTTVVGIALILALACTAPVAGMSPQTGLSPQAKTMGQSDTASAPPQDLVDADIDAAFKQIDESKNLDDATRDQLKELYAQAKKELAAAKQQQEATSSFASQVENAAADLEAAKQQKSAPAPLFDLQEAKSRDLQQLTSDHASLETQLSDAKKSLAEKQREPQRRITRLAELPAAISEQAELLKGIDSDLAAIAATEAPPQITRARTTLLRTRRQTALASIAALESERKAYAAQGELPRLQVDLDTARVQFLEQQVLQMVEIITTKRKLDANVQKDTAEQAIQTASKPLKPFAQVNLDLVNRRLVVANEIRLAVATRDKNGRELNRWQKDLARTREQFQRDRSDAIGLVLVEKRDTLPSLATRQRRLADAEARLVTVQSELFKLEDRREDLSYIDSAVQAQLQELRSGGVQLPSNAEAELAGLFALEVRILDSLLIDANRIHNLRIAATSDLRELVSVVREYNEFINSSVFKVRTAEPLSWSNVTDVPAALMWLTDPIEWRKAASNLKTGVERHTLLVAALIAALFIFRRPLRKQRENLGRQAAPISCRSFGPTFRTLLLTAVLAAPWPLVLACVGWELGGNASALLRSISLACSTVALWLFSLEVIRQICSPLGLAEAHFGWPARRAAVVRMNLLILGLVGAPLLALTIVFEHQRNADYRESVGRLALVALQLLTAYIVHRLLHLQQGIFAETLERYPDSWLGRFRGLWRGSAVLLPIALTVLAILGFQYTSYRLTLETWSTLALIVSLFIAGAVMFRWVRIQRRQLRWQQYVDARQRNADDEAAGMNDMEAFAAREMEPDLVTMDHQSRRLITVSLICIALIAVPAIWSDVFSAFTPLLNFELWAVPETGGGVRSITLGSGLLAILTVSLAVIASRNVPGLIDVVLLGRLGIESSMRYAVTTLSQYAIAIAGILIACQQLGFSLGRAQWLIAALSVGLGFGLQEVVANFICGILVLFEQPIRIGDTVTLGETTGVVVRIRSRATTVRNWDRQEVIIPNKELITGRIVNWTLTDQLNRVVIKVGVAYGSDTERTRKILIEVTESNSNVLDDPRPRVTFEQFGDSTLNFTLHAHLASMEHRLETIHELHSAINRRLTEEKIEIAFPQRDLHIRSLPPADSDLPIP